jgi:hypothetical protein
MPRRALRAALAVAVCLGAAIPCAQAFGPGLPVPAAPAFLRRSGLGSAVRNDGPVRFSLGESPRANARKGTRGEKACTAVWSTVCHTVDGMMLPAYSFGGVLSLRMMLTAYSFGGVLSLPLPPPLPLAVGRTPGRSPAVKPAAEPGTAHKHVGVYQRRRRSGFPCSCAFHQGRRR